MCMKKKDTKNNDPTRRYPQLYRKVKVVCGKLVVFSEKANKFWTEKAINSEKSMEGERERESEKH